MLYETIAKRDYSRPKVHANVVQRQHHHGDLGDVEKSYNPDGYNFTGPTLAPTGGFVVQKRINLIEKKKKRRKRYDLDGDVVPEAF